MNKNLEFERKFLLVRKPLVRADSIYKIEQHYYDAFNSNLSKRNTMVGLDINKPLFLFKLAKHNKSEFIPIEYALRWMGEGSDKPWIIYQLNTSNGNATELATGIGMDSYKKNLVFLNKKGIGPCDIIWGGCNDRS